MCDEEYRMKNYLIDAKIVSVHFDFDANNISKSQDVILILEKLEDELTFYMLKFIDVSGFKFSLDIGNKNIVPTSYEADSMYIESINLLEKSANHVKWEIRLIDNIGNIVIFSDGIEILKNGKSVMKATNLM